MVNLKHAVMGLLIVGLHIAGGDSLTVYHKVGEDASLPCSNVIHPNCSSTTWLYNNNTSETFEDVAHGMVKGNSGRQDRLSLTSNCSLTVHDVTTEDAGRYTCQQYPREGGPQQGEAALVDLSVLTMSSFPPVTHLEPDGPVVLSCSLYSYDERGGCQSSLSLNWVDETGGKLQAEPKYQITKNLLCKITLTMTLQKEDINRRCHVNHGGGKVETSIDFTPKFSDGSSATTSVVTTHSDPKDGRITSTSVVTAPPDTNDSATTSVVTTHSNQKAVAGAIGAAVVVCALMVVILVCKKTAMRRKPTGDNIEDPDDGITYATLNHSRQKTAPKADTQQEDTVTYASINNSSSRDSEPLSLKVDHTNLYATVTKRQGEKKSK